MTEILGVCIFFYSTHVFLEVTVSIWKAVGKEQLVVIILKSMSEGHGVVVSVELLTYLSLELILEISYLLSCSVPASAVCFLHPFRKT